MKFDKKDKELIAYLYHHYREPLTKISKSLKLSRDQVEYRLKKYEKEGLIKKYATLFNYDLLGYHEVVTVWIKLNSGKETIKQELEKSKNVLSVGEVLFKYDLYVNFIFKNKVEFEDFFYSFIERNKTKIKDFSILITTFIEFYPLKFFGEALPDKEYDIISSNKEVKLSKKDIGILRALEKNGRAKIIDIAKETNLSSELIVYKIKQLNKNKVILGTRLLLGMENFGFYFAVLRLKLKNMNNESKDKLKLFCKKHNNINILSFGVSNYNCLIQSFYQKEQELRQTIRDIKKELGNEILDSELLLIENEGRVKTLPF